MNVTDVFVVFARFPFFQTEFSKKLKKEWTGFCWGKFTIALIVKFIILKPNSAVQSNYSFDT